MWNCCTLTSIMDLWLHDQISDMIHHGMIMADIVWPIFKWPLNDHGHGLAENNPSAPGRPIFGLLRASVYISEPLPAYFFSVFCPRDEVTARCGRRLDVFDWGHGGAGRRRYWTLSKRLTILKIYSVTTLSRLCQKGSQYVAIDWELDTIADFTPQDPFPCVSLVWTVWPPITFNQHSKHICNQEELICRIGSTDF